MDYREQVTKNIDVAFDFLNDLLDHPRELDEIEHGENLVLVPDADPELAAANMELVRDLAQKGMYSRAIPVGPQGQPAILA